MFCELAIANLNSLYSHQIITGFMMLQEQGLLKYTISENNILVKEFSQECIVECIINNKRIIYDLADGYNNFTSFKAFDNMLDNVDVYFKRSVRKDYHKELRNRKKIKVLGFGLFITFPGIFMNKHWIGNRSVKEHLSLFARETPYLHNSFRNSYLDALIYPPQINSAKRVFFYTRLWDPKQASARSSQNVDLDGETPDRIKKKAEEFAAISAMRANCVRELKKEFGGNFVGGVVRSPYAEQSYPDIIVDSEISKRDKYTKAMQSADICITTRGTHHCFSWSFTEGIMASKGLVTEKPFYALPSHFHEGINFLAYTTPQNCVEKARSLYDNDNTLYKMMEANQDYYQNHLRPDKMIKSTLEYIAKSV